LICPSGTFRHVVPHLQARAVRGRRASFQNHIIGTVCDGFVSGPGTVIDLSSVRNRAVTAGR
jgi:hypothetical protein